MAIKIHEFFDHYKRSTLAFFVLAQLFSVALGGIFGWLGWQVLGLEAGASFVFALLMMSISNIMISLAMFRRASRPLKVISQAVAHVSSDPVLTPPPDINHPIYQRNGLKDIVQTIYQLAVAAGPGTNKANETGKSQGQEYFQHLIDTLPCGIIVLDSAGKVAFTNQTAPVKPAPGDQTVISLTFEQNDNLEKWLKECQDNKLNDVHLWQRVADKLPGEEGRRVFDVIGRYQKNDPSGIDVLLAAFDRTEAYAPDQDDMDFIALAAHELRGPITVIRGYLDVLGGEMEGKLEPDQKVLLDRLQVSAERLSGYVNNILNVSRFDRHSFSMHLHEDKLLDILQSLASDLTLRAQTQNRKLTFHIPDNLPTIAADRTSLSEVIVNLIDNGIKYSHEGGEVVIKAAIKDNFVEVTIEDKGIGIPDNVVGNLFSKFYRSHRSKGTVGGTGLGLYICKAIIDGHGGTIWVRSTEGQGSTFGFTVPIYSTVAQKLAEGDNKDITERSEGWIKNHAMIRR